MTNFARRSHIGSERSRQGPSSRPANPVSFWMAVDVALGAMAAAAMLLLILEGL